MLEIKAEKQNLYRTDADGVIADSRNYLTAKFELSEEWTGEVTAIFGYGGKFYHQVLTENSCTVPWEVIHAPYFTVSLFCGDLITSDELRIRVGKSGFEDGEVPGTPTSTVWQGYIDELAEKNREIAEELDKNVDKKIDGKADKTEVGEELEKKANKEDVDHALADKADKTEVDLLTERSQNLKYYGNADISPSDASYFYVSDDGHAIVGLTDDGAAQTELIIPYEIDGKEITEITENFSFSNCPSLLSLVIPNSVTKMTNAFSVCTALKTVVLSEGITSISASAFGDCTALTSIVLPDSLTHIGNSTFKNCTALCSINIPNGVTLIEAGAFYGCQSLVSIKIPVGVPYILSDTFLGCTGLKSISIPNSVTDIDGYTFDNCSDLTFYCEQGSVADAYAKSKNISVKYDVVNDAATKAELGQIVDEKTKSIPGQKTPEGGEIFNSYDDKDGPKNEATAMFSHAEGSGTKAKAMRSHTEGYLGEATGDSAHVEGGTYTGPTSKTNKATAYAAHSENVGTEANGEGSHSEGVGTQANSYAQHAQGTWNIPDNKGKYAHIVGNGSMDDSGNISHSNAHTVDWDGVGWFAGGVKVGGSGQDDEEAKDVALKTELPAKVSDLENDEGYVKNTDVASYTKLGLVQGSGSFGFGVNQRGVGFVQKADNTMITARTDSYHPIVPSNLDYAVRSVLPQTADTAPSVLAANTEYYLGETAELTFAFPTAGELGQYCFVKFDSGETAAVLTVSGNNFAGDIPAPKANTTYEIIATWNGTKWVSSYRGY